MCSPAVSPLKLDGFSSLSPPNSERQREEETQPSFFPHQHPIRTKPTLINSVFFPERAFTLLPSDLGKLILAPLHHWQFPDNNSLGTFQQAAQGQGTGSECLDIISCLPVEISVMVLLYLTPQDLCSASAVCSRWYQLSLHSHLYKIRKDYLQQKREEYKESRENYPPHCSSSLTPTRPRTTTFSPLSSVQPTSPPPPPLPHQRHSYSQPTSPTGLESSRNSTPSPTLLVDRVSRLSLNDQDIRQCLFSKLPPHSPSTPEGDGGKCLKAGLYPSRLKEGRKLSAKKKNRLRRL